MPDRLTPTPLAEVQADPAAHQVTNGFWRVATAKADKKRAEVHVFGPIGMDFFGDGVNAKAFIDEVNALDVDTIDMRVNSPGGSAFDGMAIATALMRHPAKVTAWVDGMAASAASVIALAGDEVIASKYSQFMVHNARLFAGGNADELRAAANHLERLNGSMAEFYADRATAGLDAKAWGKAMDRETWYNADEMLAAGIATSIDTSTERPEVEAAVASMMKLAVASAGYQYAGRGAAPAPPLMFTPATMTKGTPIMATKQDIAKSLGLPDDATDEDIKAKLAEVGLGDPAPSTNPEAPIVADPVPPVPAPAVPAAASAAAGDTVQLDKATYDAMIANAALGAKAHETLVAQADARIVDKAIAEGRIMPSRRAHYVAEMQADREHVTDLLTNQLQPGVAVPLAEVGHSAEADASAVDSVITDQRFVDWKV